MTTITKRRTSRWTPLGVAATVLGFFVWWPIGLATLAYIVWGGSVDELINDLFSKAKSAVQPAMSGSGGPQPTGNAAFDAYREETLRRLEEERAAFDEFVTKLREARDREEFERFMKERKSAK